MESIAEGLRVAVPTPGRAPATLRPLAGSALLFGALLAATPLLSQSAPAGADRTDVRQEVARAAATITPERVFEHLYVLASDGLRGRDTPSPGLEAAAAYLVSRHRGAGLAPAGENGTYYQRYPFPLIGPDLTGTRLAVRGPAGTVRLEVGTHAFVRGGRDGALDGPVVGMERTPDRAPEAGAFEGRVVLFPLAGEWGTPLLRAAAAQASVAQQGGANAVIHVLDSGAVPADQFDRMARSMAEPARLLGGEPPFPQIFIRADALEGALGTDGLWRELALEARIPVRIHDDASPPNVLAILPGSDPVLRDEYVVLSAHFDHVGIGRAMDGDSIYNGADDNGSGTTALLEVARALASLPQAPRRSIVFAHVSAEEKGLLGARWFVDHPTLPLENVVANLNADMVGGEAHPDTIVVLGKEYSDLGPLVDRVNAGLPELNLVTSPDLWPEQRLFFRSDQFHFMRKEIPSLFFFTGLHECYHRPCDDLDFVSTEKIARVARLLTHAVVEIANRDERPSWDPEGLAEVRRMISGGR